MKAFDALLRWFRSHLTVDQRRFVKFLVVGASGVPVNLGTVYVVTHVAKPFFRPSVRDTVAYLSGIAVSIFTNFLLNNAWTWGDRTRGDRSGFFARLLKFYLVSSVAASVQFFTSVGLSSVMRGSPTFSLPISGEFRLYHALAPSIGILLGLVINFTANHLWTFRKGKGGP